jgi:hydroxymethylbilane synthase
MTPIVIGTRATPLARIQAALMAGRLRQFGFQTDIKAMSSQGDRSLGGSFAQSKGVFTGELSAALRDGSVDLVVHSLKDLPVDDEPGLVIAAVPERERPFDLLLLAPGLNDAVTTPLAAVLEDDAEGASRRAEPASEALAGLPAGARLGTSSPRRQAGALALRPDLVCCAVRGSVGRRLEWLQSSAIHALLAAEAGIVRLARNGELEPWATALRSSRLDLASWPCAPGQGALAVQVLRGGRLDGHPAMTRLDHPPTRTAVLAERSLLGRLGGGCLRPFGAWADVRESTSRQPSLRAIHVAIAPDNWREAAGAGAPPLAARVTASATDGDGGVDLDALAARIERDLTESPPSAAAGRRAGTASGGPIHQAGTSTPGVGSVRTPDLIVTSAPTTVRRLARRLDPAIRVAALPATAVDVFDAPWPVDRIDLDRPRRQWPWLLISSPTAARVVAERAAREPIWGRLPWCALGEGTARALLAAGVPPNLAARAADGRGLADYAARVLDRRCPLLVPHSARGGRSLVEALEAAGREVVAWQAYTVGPAPDLAWPGGWQAGRARVLFTAPSAVAAFAASGLDWPGSCWAIGATTAAALRNAGVGNVTCAHEPTAAGIERLWNEEVGGREETGGDPSAEASE